METGEGRTPPGTRDHLSTGRSLARRIDSIATPLDVSLIIKREVQASGIEGKMLARVHQAQIVMPAVQTTPWPGPMFAAPHPVYEYAKQ